MEKIMFSVDDYTSDGNIGEKGVYLHFGDTRVKVAEDKEDFCSNAVSMMQRIVNEIKGNY